MSRRFPTQLRQFLITTVCTMIFASAAAADELAGFLEQGRVLFDTRVRYENVDQQGFSKDADAGTVRERLGYETASVLDMKALVEVQATQQLSHAFNDTVNGRTSYPQVPDPEAFALNRLQVAYSGQPGIAATLGRQVINLDDQRFIGASAFRQNEQTFDAMRLDYTGLSNLTATYSYVNRVNRIFSNRSPAGHFNGDIHLVNIGYDISGVGKLSAYTYLLDLDHNPLLSTATYGTQLAGGRSLDDRFKIRYLAGYARQTPYAANSGRYALDYWRLEGGIDYQSWSLTAGAEILGGNGTIGFSTPLATLHAFQGDADAFLTTPPQGVADQYAKLTYQTGFDVLDGTRKLTLIAWYHDFESVHGSGGLGHELDFSAIINISDHWRFDLTHAVYDGASGIASRDKTWLSLSVTH